MRTPFLDPDSEQVDVLASRDESGMRRGADRLLRGQHVEQKAALGVRRLDAQLVRERRSRADQRTIAVSLGQQQTSRAALALMSGDAVLLLEDKQLDAIVYQ